MKPIAFFDTEVDPKTRRILDIGCVRSDGSELHKSSITEFISFLKGSTFLCGHNVVCHDLKYVGSAIRSAGIDTNNTIDTLFLSPLLFPTKPYHALVKDDKLDPDELNNPLTDSKKARDLFHAEVAVFNQMDETLRQILYQLLYDKTEFGAFFRYLDYTSRIADLKVILRLKFKNEICDNCNLEGMISRSPVELAYCIALINSLIINKSVKSLTPPWIQRNYPSVENVMHLLRSKPCLTGCEYCNSALDVNKGLKRIFGFDSFRTYGGEPLQELAAKAAVNNKSLLAVFPTGGGKSVTFQLPALMSGENCRGLTVVISPLQSLMKDQVDNLERQGITAAVTINGLIDPIERSKSMERVESGDASILYISPESLRSKTIERLISRRKIVRFVIDEAHCFSTWGQDFRVDYMYIGEFIQLVAKNKQLEEAIPVSCFTATAKQKVIEDIRAYFRDRLSLELELFTAGVARTNLHYNVIGKSNKQEKYQAVRDLIEEKDCPTIIYVSRTRNAEALANDLIRDGYKARPYHGKMEVKAKMENQNAFIEGEVPIMVATSAFGMGVDKKDVGLVIHYDISDSLENYVQEAGRAGRDENISADCYVLYDEEDLSKHFILLNQTKLSIKEIQQIWKAITEITRFRSQASNSALEIARRAGWDDTVGELETRVTTAIAALEDAGYLKRGQNMPRVFANSIQSKNAQEAIDQINISDKFEENQKNNAIRVIKKLISSKNRKHALGETPEARIDYISDHLGIDKREVINIVNILREEKILADAKDLTAFIRRGESSNRSVNILRDFSKLEMFLANEFHEEKFTYNLKDLNERAENAGCSGVTLNRIRTVINFWEIRHLIEISRTDNSKNRLDIKYRCRKNEFNKKLESRHELANFITNYLHNKSMQSSCESRDEVLVEFSVHELKQEFENQLGLFGKKISIDDVEDALHYLSKIETIKIEGGFLVVYNRLTVERTEQDSKKRFKVDDYKKLNQFYENKVQQIHIVGEYANRMINDYRDALQFVDDYFQLNYQSFLNKYFKGSRQNEIKRNMTPARFRKLFGELSATQLSIINDSESKHIIVAAGPGSGKTRVLVHKLASLVLMEDVKYEQLLMLTFTRAAATEFKKRLIDLIGNAALFIDIMTFHSYCFDLLGKLGSLEKTESIVSQTIAKIKSGEIERSRITKVVLVIDEAQDMDFSEYELVRVMMEQNEEMRVIMVGDDDQNIFSFRGSSSIYMKIFMKENNAKQFELIENYRSRRNLVTFSNKIAEMNPFRLKNIPIQAKQSENGEIKVIRYQSGCHLTIPLVNDILKSRLTGTTCVICTKNEEVTNVAGLLLSRGLKAELIQEVQKFYLKDMMEVRFIINQFRSEDNVYIIDEEKWIKTKDDFRNKFRLSDKLSLCEKILNTFEEINPKRKYISDFVTFISESKLEDFYNDSGETILVSTIHKAKGKEFDNVFLLIENFNFNVKNNDNDEKKYEELRKLYVAMTRAKKNLTVHLNTDFFDRINFDDMNKEFDDIMYDEPAQMTLQLTHEDVWLDWFASRQNEISGMKSGDPLIIREKQCLNKQGRPILEFSQKFMSKLSGMKMKGYVFRSAKIGFMMHWLKLEADKEILIVLPELIFERH